MTDWRTWAIDEERVLQDRYSWEEMYRKQRQIPGLIIAVLVSGAYLLDAWEWLVVFIPFVVFSAWPAYGAYTMMKRGQDDS